MSNEAENSKQKKRKTSRRGKTVKGSFARSLIMGSGATLLIIIIVVMILGNFFPDVSGLDKPKTIISDVVTPVQSFFTRGVRLVTGYFRNLKYRSNLEYEYEQALIKLEEYQDVAALANEYAARINAFEDLKMENVGNAAMNPIGATVIGHDTGNYFTTLDLDRGSRDGVEDYMAVVFGGGLVGYTYDVKSSTCKVATIIDSDTTIPALMSSTRDQGSVKGTYGITGEAVCRMFYLPENHLPRTGDLVVTSGVGMPFPKGIPIGTVRESTRGMEDNKQFIVIQPIVDFQHLEYVNIFRYIPSYAETAQLSETVAAATYVPLATARPLPTFAVGVGTSFEEGGINTPIPVDVMATPEVMDATATPQVTPNPTTSRETFVFVTTAPPQNLEYVRTTPTPVGPTPTPTPTPSPTPLPQFDMEHLTTEEDE